MAKTVDSPLGGAMVNRRLRAPRRHGDALLEPPLAIATRQLQQNQQRLADSQSQLHGRSLQELSHSGRQELLDAAQRYTSTYRNAIDAHTSQILLTGHQPELYHPGVWFKNFVLDAFARRVSAVPINLIIDNDLPRGTSISCPHMDGMQARTVAIPFDRSGQFFPYEERGILDPAQFESFADRVIAALAPLVPDALITDFWPLAVDAARRTGRLGLAFAQARHQWEDRWGLETLEVPWSTVCDTPSFRWFAAHLLTELPRLHRDYNEALNEYRRLHRLRSRTHPVADLECADEWLEAPFWFWAERDPHRRRLFVRRKQDCLELSDRRRLRICLPSGRDDLESTIETWDAIRQSGIKIRPRALMTTMYARLILGDSFVHGIGGAKYDELTDEIIRRFLGTEVPSYLTVTATLCLPIERENVEKADISRVTWDPLESTCRHASLSIL